MSHHPTRGFPAKLQLPDCESASCNKGVSATVKSDAGGSSFTLSAAYTVEVKCSEIQKN